MNSSSLVRGIDNVASLASAADRPSLYARLEALGFRLYPLGRQRGPDADGRLVPWGTGSRAASFANETYFELMGVEEPGKPDGGYADRIARYGLHLAKIQVRVPDAAAEIAALRDKGHAVADARYFERHFPGPDDEPLVARFRLFRYPPELTAGLQLTGAEHLTPEITFLAPWLNHPNGARGVAGAVIVAPEAASLARRIAALLRLETYPCAAGTTIRFPNNSTIEVREAAQGAAPSIACLRVWFDGDKAEGALLSAGRIERIGSFTIEGVRR
jgi:hypothetical protein